MPAQVKEWLIMAVRNKKNLNKDKPKCVHEFYDTKEKGFWTVEATPTNNRGGNKFVEVPVTVFKCRICGETSEYPDYWESNFLKPSKIGKKKRTPGKSTKKEKAVKA